MERLRAGRSASLKGGKIMTVKEDTITEEGFWEFLKNNYTQDEIKKLSVDAVDWARDIYTAGDKNGYKRALKRFSVLLANEIATGDNTYEIMIEELSELKKMEGE